MEEPLNCLLCGGEMKLAGNEETTWWQCQEDFTHRMRLPEWSDLVHHQNRTKEQIIEVMRERSLIIQAEMLKIKASK